MIKARPTVLRKQIQKLSTSQREQQISDRQPPVQIKAPPQANKKSRQAPHQTRIEIQKIKKSGLSSQIYSSPPTNQD